MAAEKNKEKSQEIADDYQKLRSRSVPSESDIEEQSLTAEEDQSQGFQALARRRRWEKWREQEALPPVELAMDFNVRVRVKPDRLKVAWKDHGGMNRTTDAWEISMHGIKFNSAGSEPSAIKSLIFTRSNVSIGIKNAELYSMEGDFAIIRLVEFDNNIEDWMTWIEKLSRINKE